MKILPQPLLSPAWGWLLLCLGVAGLLTFFKVPLATAQGQIVLAVKINGPLPKTDPTAALWQQATAIEVPLSAQTVTRPRFFTTNIKAVTVRALYNDTELAFLVEWADPTLNASAVRVQDFRDAVALQFPLVTAQPFFCMGQLDGYVNIWHWKADWQDFTTVYPNMVVEADPLLAEAISAPAARHFPVEDLIAGGYGTLTSQAPADQNVGGVGQWANGRWAVIFSRALASPGSEDVQFQAGQQYPLALAAWDGANQERNGMKSTSRWLALQMGAPSVNRLYLPLITRAGPHHGRPHAPRR